MTTKAKEPTTIICSHCGVDVIPHPSHEGRWTHENRGWGLYEVCGEDGAPNYRVAEPEVVPVAWRDMRAASFVLGTRFQNTQYARDTLAQTVRDADLNIETLKCINIAINKLDLALVKWGWAMEKVGIEEAKLHS